DKQQGPLGGERHDSAFDDAVVAEELARDRHLDGFAVDPGLERLAADDVREHGARRQPPVRRRRVGVILLEGFELVRVPNLGGFAQHLPGGLRDRIRLLGHGGSWFLARSGPIHRAWGAPRPDESGHYEPFLTQTHVNDNALSKAALFTFSFE